MPKPPKAPPMTRADALRWLATYLQQRPMMPAADKNAFYHIDKFLREDLQTMKGKTK